MDLKRLQGSWAVVTGASAGIGRAFAQQLAQRGVNVALVARREELLASLARSLETQHGVQMAVVPLDLAEPGAATILCNALAVRQIHPRLLVNNAAVGRWGRFENPEPAVYRQMALLNAVVTMELCQTLLPDLQKEGFGAVVNVSSPAAFQPVPYMAAYAASKAFVHSLSLALHEEWKGCGVYVQTLVPGPTATEFDARAGAYESHLGADRDPPEKIVAASLQAFGRESPLVVCAKGIPLQRLFATLAPTRFMLTKVGNMFRPPTS